MLSLGRAGPVEGMPREVSGCGTLDNFSRSPGFPHLQWGKWVSLNQGQGTGSLKQNQDAVTIEQGVDILGRSK